MSELPPPGWYPDAEDAGSERWWDGRTWTDTLRARSAAASYVALEPAPPANRAAAVSVVFGILSAAIVGSSFVGLIGLDPLLALLLIAFATTAIATGVPGIVRARRLVPPAGRTLGIVGVVLGSASIVLTVVGILTVVAEAASGT